MFGPRSISLGRFVSPAKNRSAEREGLSAQFPSQSPPLGRSKNVFRVREPRFPSGPLTFCARKDANLPSAVPVAGVGLDRPPNDRSIRAVSWCFGAKLRMTRDFSQTGNDFCRSKSLGNGCHARTVTSDAAMRVTEMLLAMALVAIAAPAVRADCLTNTDVEGFFLGLVRR